MFRNITAAVFALTCAPAFALDVMPEPGWGGFINLGVGTGSVESNMLASLSGIDRDLSDDTINNFGSPDDESVTLPVANLNIGYTFASGKTRVFLGNDLADFVQFDQATLLALRHDIDGVGRLQFGALATAGITTEVYEDPYVLNAKRGNTERTMSGGRITWDKIMGSQFELQVETRTRDIDEERSGEGLGLSDPERKLLDREGDVNRVDLGYLFSLADGKHFLRPSVAYVDRDLDGGAMAQDGYRLGLSHLYNSKRFRMVNNITYASMDGDKDNPIFGDAYDADEVFLSSQMFFPGAFGWKNWMPRILIAWGEEDTDIDFYDTQVWMINASLFRTF